MFNFTFTTKTIDNKKHFLNELYKHVNDFHNAQNLPYTHDNLTHKRKCVDKINKHLKELQQALTNNVLTIGHAEAWPADLMLSTILLTSYSINVMTLEFRNRIWPYNNIDFSRRIGELWEGFCRVCFEYPVEEDIVIISPPNFKTVHKEHVLKTMELIKSLEIKPYERRFLIESYNTLMGLTPADNINLTLDIHFNLHQVNYAVDFKSGFSSNEKGNTNRLLLVARIYQSMLTPTHKCILLVRSNENENNNYFQRLKKSNLWMAYCGEEAYEQIENYTGFNLKAWILNNIDWSSDLSPETVAHLAENNLLRYLSW